MSGRVAVVTGAASGIGLGVANRLAADGIAVALLDRDGTGRPPPPKRSRAKDRRPSPGKSMLRTVESSNGCSPKYAGNSGRSPFW